LNFFKEELEKYLQARPKSQSLWGRSVQALAGGVSHNIRSLGLPSIEAFPIFVKSADGPNVVDIDDIRYIDFWQGHFAMILGHRHPAIQEVLEEKLTCGWHIGWQIEDQIKLAETLIHDNPSIEKIRFCTSGTESTMYASRLARAFTGKRIILKAKMGWHGPNDTLFYDVRSPFTGKESPGILHEKEAGVVTFNPFDYDASEKMIQTLAKDLAAVIIEPVLGGGGGFSVDDEFLKLLREETEKHDILLIFDEVITGYRFNYGLYQKIIGVLPDITSMGKIIGGGMPCGAIGGRDEIIEQANPQLKNRVWIGGGTFSANPLSMAAGLKTLELLKKSKSEYHRINQLGDSLRNDLNSYFKEHNLNFIASGTKSILFLHGTTKFIEDIDPNKIIEITDVNKETWLSLTLLNRQFTGMHGIGSLVFQHNQKHIDRLKEAIEEIVHPISAG
jgi:glutamate-1-semialdehyde 2,1-aminomutase